MTEFAVKWIDVAPFLAARQQPVVVLPRVSKEDKHRLGGTTECGSATRFWVPSASLLSNDAKFSLIRHGDFVRVPMFGYKTTHRSVADVFALGIQLASVALTQLHQHEPKVPGKIHLFPGNEATDMHPAEECFQCYVGLAFEFAT